MNEVKPWYQSKTMWGALVSLAALITGKLFHMDISDQDQLTIVDTMTSIGVNVGVILTIWGRVAASKKIS